MGITGNIADVAIEKTYGWTVNKLDEVRIKNVVNGYLMCEKTHFNCLSNNEVFDWDGLAGFINRELFNKIADCLNSIEARDREQLRYDVLQLAYSNAHADTAASRHLVDNIMLGVMNILLYQRLNRVENILPYNHAVDELLNAMGKHNEEILNQFSGIKKKTFETMIDELTLHHSVNESPFDYRNSKIGFYGREEDYMFLDEFRKNDKSLLFTVISGFAGVGKSKFLYHNVKALETNPSWKPVFILQSNIVMNAMNAEEWQYPKNLLLIIDYAGNCSSILGQWFTKLYGSRARPDKMRFILLMREDSASRCTDQQPIWYDRLFYGKDISSAYIREIQYPFKTLLPLKETDLIKMMNDYAVSLKRDYLTPEQWRNIMEFCRDRQKMGSLADHLRPLMVLFVTDAWIRNSDVRAWNMEDVFNNLIIRYVNHWRDALCGSNENAAKALEMLMLYATAVGEWDTDKDLPAPFDNSYAELRAYSSMNISLDELFKGACEKVIWDGILSPIEPDLAGEYFVLRYLQRLGSQRRCLPLVHAFWLSEGHPAFLGRCISDFASREMFKDLFKNGMEALTPDNGGIFAEKYSDLLLELSREQKPTDVVLTMGRLKRLVDISKDSQIAVSMAKGLYYLTENDKQDLPGRKWCVEELHKLAAQFDQNNEIAVLLAKGLICLGNRQDFTGMSECVRDLRDVAEKFPKNEEIAVLLANNLFNLTVDKNLHSELNGVEELRKLAGRFQENEDIAVLLANGTFNLSITCGFTEDQAEELHELAEQFPKNKEIAVRFAHILSDFLTGQDLPSRTTSVEELRELTERFPENAEIIIQLAKVLFCLTLSQDLSGILKSVKELRYLAERLPDNEEIAAYLAKGLFQLASSQGLPDMMNSVKELFILTKWFPNNGEINIQYKNRLSLYKNFLKSHIAAPRSPADKRRHYRVKVPIHF